MAIMSGRRCAKFGKYFIDIKSGYNVLGCSRFFDAHGGGKESVSKSCFCVNLLAILDKKVIKRLAIRAIEKFCTKCKIELWFCANVCATVTTRSCSG